MQTYHVVHAEPVWFLRRGRSRGLRDPVLVLAVSEGPQEDFCAVRASAEVQVDDEVRSGIVQAGHCIAALVRFPADSHESSPVAVTRGYWLPCLLVAADRDESTIGRRPTDA